jgi:hypothetical protein
MSRRNVKMRFASLPLEGRIPSSREMSGQEAAEAGRVSRRPHGLPNGSPVFPRSSRTNNSEQSTAETIGKYGCFDHRPYVDKSGGH